METSKSRKRFLAVGFLMACLVLVTGLVIERHLVSSVYLKGSGISNNDHPELVQRQYAGMIPDELTPPGDETPVDTPVAQVTPVDTLSPVSLQP